MAAPEGVPQSATLRVPLKAYSSTDHITDKTGLTTLAVVISKNGAAFGNPSAGVTNATEVANGWYYVDLSTTDTGSLGPLIVRATASGTDNVELAYNVVGGHNGGFDGVPAVAAGASGGLPTGNASGQVTVGGYASGQAPLQPTTAGRTLDVAATGEAGLDFDNIHDASGAHTLSNITVPAVTTTANLTTNNDKTGYALISGYDPAKTAAQAGDAMALTSGERTTLTAAIWNALTSGLTTASSIGKLLVDNINATIGSRSSHSAADVWAVVTRVLTAGTNIVLAKGTGVTGFNDLDAAAVTTASTAATPTAAAVTGNVGGNVAGSVGSVTGNVGGNVVGSVGSVVATVAANLTQILGTAFTEGAVGRVAAAFKQFFNVASPSATMDHGILVDTATAVTNRVTANADQIEGADATDQIRDAILSDATPFPGANVPAIKTQTDQMVFANGAQVVDLRGTLYGAFDAVSFGVVTFPVGFTAEDDALDNRVLVILDGVAAGSITILNDDYNGTTKQATVVGWPADAPTGGDHFALLPYGPTNLQQWLRHAPTPLSTLGNVRADLEEWRQLQPAALTGSAGNARVAATILLAGDFAQAAADKVWGSSIRTLTSFGTLIADIWTYVTRVLTGGDNIVLNKGTGITGFNDVSNSDVQADAVAAIAAAEPIDANVVSGVPSAADNADAVWDEALADHLGLGSTGEQLQAAGASGDPWATPLPGAYPAGSAGAIVGDNLDVPVGSRAVAGDAMTLTGGERAALTAVIWAASVRSLTTFGTLVVDIWANAGRTLTSGVNIVLTKGTGLLGLNDPTADENADALLDRADAIETGWTLRKILRLMASSLAGRTTGGHTNTIHFRDLNDTKDRIVAATDLDATGSDRTSVTLDGD